MKTMRGSILITIGMVIILASGAWTLTKTSSGRHGFIVNQKVFDQYKGKQRLELELMAIKKLHANSIDSLTRLITIGQNSELVLDQMKTEFDLQEQSLSSKFTADIWSEINRLIEQFGKEKGFDFIYGANGNGNLMYANTSADVTHDVIEFINSSYAGN